MKAYNVLAVSSVLLLSSTALRAQEAENVHPLLGDRFYVAAAAFFPQKEFKVAVDGSIPGEEIDFGDAFKLKESETTGAFNFQWRFGEKWSVSGQYWGLSDSKSAVLEEDIHWEDVVLEEGTYAKASTKFSVTRVFFGRRFSASDMHEFGLGAGLHWLEVGASIEGQALSNVGDTEVYRGSVSAGAPLPNIGGWYTYAFNSKWAFTSRLDWLSASVGEYSGSLWNAGVGLHWAIFDHFGAAASYNYFKLDVDVDKSDWHGGFETSQYGPSIQLSAYW